MLGSRDGDPEGIPLRFALATAGDRISAFLIDFLLISAVVGVIALLVALASVGTASSWFVGLFYLANFLVRNFYFIYFELRWQGSTPGKRRLGLRVIDQKGGALTAEAVFGRNLTRDVEIFLPLTAVLNPELIWSEAPGWGRLVAVAWMLVLALLPVLNKNRLRLGDLVGGTMVVLAPKAVLLQDLSDAAKSPAAAAAAPHYTFSDKQLDVYGIFELHILEDLLRRQDLRDPTAYEVVCEKIKKKIAWPQEQWQVTPQVFLRDFYAAQRARLEHRMLLGKRKEHKAALLWLLEDHRQLIQIDPFFFLANVVIGHGVGGGDQRAGKNAHDETDKGAGDGTFHEGESHDGADEVRQHADDEEQSEYRALVALCQLARPLERRHDAGLFHDGHGNGQPQHAIEDDSGNDEQQQTTHDTQAIQQGHAQNGKDSREAHRQTAPQANRAIAQLLHDAIGNGTGADQTEEALHGKEQRQPDAQLSGRQAALRQEHDEAEYDGALHERGDEREAGHVFEPHRKTSVDQRSQGDVAHSRSGVAEPPRG
jgi:uncharacterized RDD family membrane protein YckC